MKKLTENQIKENLDLFYSYVDKYIEFDRKYQLMEMYKSMEITLATSPASTKEQFHNAFAGGYIDHVIRVIDFALVYDKAWTKFGQDKDYSTEELVFSAMNHDLGKLGVEDKPFYVPNDSEWHIKNGAYYKYNPELIHMRIADRSLYTLQSYGIRISENEYLAIKLHDGLYEDANKSYFFASGDYSIKSNLPYIIHQADITATRIEKQI